MVCRSHLCTKECLGVHQVQDKLKVSQMPFSLLPLATFTFQYLMGDFLELEQVVTSPTPVVWAGLYTCLMTHRYVSNSFFRSNVNVQESGNMS